MLLTNEIPRTAFRSEDLCMIKQRLPQTPAESCARADSRHGVISSDLEPMCQSAVSQIYQTPAYVPPVSKRSVILTRVRHTINPWNATKLRGPEEQRIEHVQACHSNAFASFINIVSPRFGVSPMISRARIEENRYEEEIYQTTCGLRDIASVMLPLGNEILDTGLAADLEVLPAAVGRDLVVTIGTEVSLFTMSVTVWTIRRFTLTSITPATKLTASSSLSSCTSKWLSLPASAALPTALARSLIDCKDSKYFTWESISNPQSTLPRNQDELVNEYKHWCRSWPMTVSASPHGGVLHRLEPYLLHLRASCICMHLPGRFPIVNCVGKTMMSQI